MTTRADERELVGLSETATGDGVPLAVERARLGQGLDHPVVSWVAALAITALALFLRTWRLGRPHSFSFDETYYAKDAWSLAHFGYAREYIEDANDEDPRRPNDGALGQRSRR